MQQQTVDVRETRVLIYSQEALAVIGPPLETKKESRFESDNCDNDISRKKSHDIP